MFFRDLFFNEFSMAFLMENGSRNGPISFPGTTLLAPFSRPFPKIDFYMHFGRPLAPLWLPFGSLWRTFGSPWLTFGSPWLTFGSLWLPLAPFWLPFGPRAEHCQRQLGLIYTFSQNDHFSSAPDSAKHLQNKRQEPSPKWNLSFAQPPLLPGPERNLAVGNLDPLRARRRPRRV